MTVQDIKDLITILDKSKIWLISYTQGLQKKNYESVMDSNRHEVDRLIKKLEELEVKV